MNAPFAFAFPATFFVEAAGETSRCDDEVCFAKTVQIEGNEFKLVGTATYHFIFLDCYAAALYTRSGHASLESYRDTSQKILAVQYLRTISKDRIIDSSNETIDSHPDYDAANFSSELNQLYSLFHDVKDGDRAVLLFNFPSGVTLYFNSQRLGQFEGPEFTSAYAGVWLSPYSVGRRFTRSLLGAQ
ncbi:MAG: chalcone isomerase family protein [Bdellovibrionales bacterium]|nr:chalcone isomerase family protein [Bdellovibrionales bacterium]